jgi:hypothetical protein
MSDEGIVGAPTCYLLLYWFFLAQLTAIVVNAIVVNDFIGEEEGTGNGFSQNNG